MSSVESAMTMVVVVPCRRSNAPSRCQRARWRAFLAIRRKTVPGPRERSTLVTLRRSWRNGIADLPAVHGRRLSDGSGHGALRDRTDRDGATAGLALGGILDAVGRNGPAKGVLT